MPTMIDPPLQGEWTPALDRDPEPFPNFHFWKHRVQGRVCLCILHPSLPPVDAINSLSTQWRLNSLPLSFFSFSFSVFYFLDFYFVCHRFVYFFLKFLINKIDVRWYTSGALRTFTILCNHHHFLVWDSFILHNQPSLTPCKSCIHLKHSLFLPCP